MNREMLNGISTGLKEQNKSQNKVDCFYSDKSENTF
jgi:hypothetical protein